MTRPTFAAFKVALKESNSCRFYINVLSKHSQNKLGILLALIYLIASMVILGDSTEGSWGGSLRLSLSLFHFVLIRFQLCKWPVSQLGIYLSE